MQTSCTTYTPCATIKAKGDEFMNLVYGAAETRSKSHEIQTIVKSGLIPKVINKATNESSYMMNQKIINSLLNRNTCFGK